jgi:hypothetical protein
VTVRTIARCWHPRTGITAFLLLSTTTELVVLNLIPQHDPQPDPQLASHGHARFPHTLLHQFAAVESLQLRCGMRSRLTPEKPQQRVTLFAQPTEPLSPSTGIFTWNHSHIFARNSFESCTGAAWAFTYGDNFGDLYTRQWECAKRRCEPARRAIVPKCSQVGELRKYRGKRKSVSSVS